MAIERCKLFHMVDQGVVDTQLGPLYSPGKNGRYLSAISRDRAPTFFGDLLWETEIIADKIGPQGVVYRRFW